MRQKTIFRFVCYFFVVYLIYFFALNADHSDLFKEIKVDNFGFSDTNSFHIIPFYQTRSARVKKDVDVTLVTQVSVDRLDRIQEMAETWSGPISAAVYVKGGGDEETDSEELGLIDTFFSQSEAVQTYVDIHILFANQTRYPVNNLRNLALQQAPTSLVMILDADFVTSENMHQYLSKVGQNMISRANRKKAYVVPAFSSSTAPHALPKHKSALLKALKKGSVTLVNEEPCPKCHAPTNYKKWETATEIYPVEYKWIYEPYLMLNKEYLTEFFDERLKGYGFDKNTHVFSLAAAGYQFYVLPEPFVIHRNHEVAQWDGPSIQEQLSDALDIVCDILPTSKTKNGYEPDVQLFDEPLADTCHSRSHW